MSYSSFAPLGTRVGTSSMLPHYLSSFGFQGRGQGGGSLLRSVLPQDSKSSLLLRQQQLRRNSSTRRSSRGSCNNKHRGLGSRHMRVHSCAVEAVEEWKRGGLGEGMVPHAVVVGGGPCGALAAMVLAKHGFTVDVFERDEEQQLRLPSSPSPPPPPPTSSTSPSSSSSSSSSSSPSSAFASSSPNLPVPGASEEEYGLWDGKNGEGAESETERFTYPMCLFPRGLAALETAGAKLPEGASLVTGFYYHSGAKPSYMPRSTTGWYVERNALAASLRRQAAQHPSQSVAVHHGWQLRTIDGECTAATFVKVASARKQTAAVSGAGGVNTGDENGGGDGGGGDEVRTVQFDLIVAANGVRSAARVQAVRHDASLKVTQKESDGLYEYKRLPSIPIAAFDDPSLADLEREKSVRASHFSVPKGGSTRFLVCPLPDAGYATGLWMCSDKRRKGEEEVDAKNQRPLLLNRLKSPEEVEAILRKEHPALFGAIARARPDFAEALLRQPLGRGGTSTWCSKLHWKRMLLMGDAAHSMSSALAQGCNTALEDCTVLDKVLSQHMALYKGSKPEAAINALPDALARYTRERLADVHAVVDMSYDPPTPMLATRPLSKLRGLLRMLMIMAARSVVPSMARSREIITSDLPFSRIKEQVRREEAIAATLEVAIAAAVTSTAMSLVGLL